MHAFTDSCGRTWELKITVAALERVQAHTGVDLAGLLDPERRFAPLAELLQQPVRLAQVLYALCEPQLRQRHLTPEQFGEALYGDALEAAANALVDELVFFTPNRRLREQLAALIAKSRALAETLLQEQAERIAGLQLDQLAANFAASPSSSAARSGSTPDPSASAN